VFYPERCSGLVWGVAWGHGAADLRVLVRGHRQDACATLFVAGRMAWSETRAGRPCYGGVDGLVGDKAGTLATLFVAGRMAWSETRAGRLLRLGASVAAEELIEA
jgi:hypothetical protein